MSLDLVSQESRLVGHLFGDYMTTPKKGLELLREPFPDHLISKLPKPFKKDSPKGKCSECGGFHGLPAVHLDYVGHAALTHRLLDADPFWNWKPLAVSPEGLPLFDKSGGMWIELTVCGNTRLGYGHAESKTYSDIGSREKEVIGDALRNAAMRFGAGLDLWHKGDLHEDDPHPEEKHAAPKVTTHNPIKTEPIVKNSQVKPAAIIPLKPAIQEKPLNHAPNIKNGISDAQCKRLYTLATRAGWTHDQVISCLKLEWGLTSTKEMKKESYELFCSYLEKGKTPDTIKGLPVIF